MIISLSDWRNDPALRSSTEYKQKFAFLPAMCSDGTIIWMKHYYVKYINWYHISPRVYNEDSGCLHTDRIENVSEADYIIRKLAEIL